MDKTIVKKINTIFFFCCTLILIIGFLLYLNNSRIFIVDLLRHFSFYEPLNYEKYLNLMGIIGSKIIIYCGGILSINLFCHLFVEKCNNTFLNLLRVVACLMVFMLHTSIFTELKGPLFTNQFVKLLRTPAWGGVFIFMITSGYLAGNSFCHKKYIYSLESIYDYYEKKFFRVIVPTFSFIFLCCVLCYPTFVKDNPIFLSKILTFSYNGIPGMNGIGACWYVFTLVPLYLLAPLFCYISEKISNKGNLIFYFFPIIVFLGFFYRYYCFKHGIDWYSNIYTPFYANIDLFWGGILINYIRKKIPNAVNLIDIKKISLFVLFLSIFINILTYDNTYLYQIVYPTIYLLLCGFTFMAFSDESIPHNNANIFEFVINKFAELSFEFYLFHSLVLSIILPAFNYKNLFYLHIKLLFIGGLISLILSYGFHRIFLPRGKK